MFGSQTIEVVFGLVFIYLLLSIICTAANELVAGIFKLRARNLLQGIENLLRHQGIDGLVDRFYSHPLIRSLSNGEKKPSYIPSRAFALALVDLIGQSKSKSNPFTFEKIHAAVTSNLPEDSDLRKVMQIFLDDAGRDAGKVLTSVETWFNASMERVAGWYKRKLQVLTFLIAVAGVGALNADTLQIVKTLSTDPAIRQLVVTQAQAYLTQHPAGDTGQALSHTGGGSNPARFVGNKPLSSGGSKDQAAPTPHETIQQTVEQLQQFGIPLGWQAAPKARELPNKIIGLLLTVLAVSLGAPFWFDILSRVSKIRSTGAAPADEAQRTEKAEK